ncbi:MAG: oxygenase MpaB family protein [Actinomycetales bacterium]
MSLTTTLDRRLGLALRSRVAGQDALSRNRKIWGSRGPRWFTPDDPIWRVQADASMFPGGVAALLLQSLHPSAMAGVADHSGYRSDPWGRLQRTAEYLATTTFGTIEHAEEFIDVVRHVHRHVVGADHRGRPYRADDPHLLRWVHLAQTWTFLAAHQRYGAHPLTSQEADVFVAQSTVASSRVGAVDLPETVAELEAALLEYRDELELTPAAQASSSFLLRRPPLPVPARPGYFLIAAGGVAVLPDWARTMLRLTPDGLRLHAARIAGRASTTIIRRAMAAVSQDRRLPDE